MYYVKNFLFSTQPLNSLIEIVKHNHLSSVKNRHFRRALFSYKLSGKKKKSFLMLMKYYFLEKHAIQGNRTESCK